VGVGVLPDFEEARVFSASAVTLAFALVSLREIEVNQGIVWISVYVRSIRTYESQNGQEAELQGLKPMILAQQHVRAEAPSP